MPKPASVRADKIAISLPSDLLAAVERLRRSTGESRSAVIRRAVEHLLGRIERDDMVREYVSGYLTHPESKAEIDAAGATSVRCLAEEPWQ
jgi:metal-responsive CopG/Arc/MetJ family transcriptional regulator